MRIYRLKRNGRRLWVWLGIYLIKKKDNLFKKCWLHLGHNLMVTPKEVDVFIEDMANVLAAGLNAALHRQVDQENVGAYTH